MSTKALKQQLIAAIAMVLVAAIALASSTYAWFVNNATVTATGAEVTASTAYSLLISKVNGTDWQTTKALAANSGLTPVSTIGTRIQNGDIKTGFKTASDTAATATLGDVRFVASNAWKDNLVINYDEVSKESITVKTESTSKYYYTDTVFLKAGQASKIALDSNSTGLVWKDWDKNNHAEATTGTFYTFADFVSVSQVTDASANAEALAAYNAKLAKAQALVKTLRVGLQVTNIRAETSVDAINALRASSSSSGFYVYQLTSTPFGTTANTTKQGSAEGVTKAIGPKTSESLIAANGADENLNDDGNNTLAFANGSPVPVIADRMVAGSATGIVNLDSKDSLATVAANDVVQVDIYIWMEGCDYDVIAANLNEFNAANIPGIQFGFCLAQ